MTKPSENQESKIVTYLLETLEDYKKLNKSRNDKLLKIYQSFSTYEEEKTADWMTNFKVNKAHEIVERVTPRIIAKNPRWIVTPKTNDFYPDQELPKYIEGDEASMMAYNEALKAKTQKTTDYSRAIQDYLEYIFDEYNYEKSIRAFAKAGVVYGKGRAKVGYKYETVRKVVEVENESGEITKEISEVVSGEYPTIEVKSWTEIYSDPRYKTVRDMPAYFEFTTGVRIADLKRKKEEYFNLDKLERVCDISLSENDIDNYVSKVRAAAEIPDLDIKTKVDKNALNLLTAWAYWEDEDTEDAGSKERLYEFCLIPELRLLLSMKEVTRIPFAEFDVFEDTETNFAVGFVEPILGLQDELNFQKNSAVNFINQALNRTFVWSANSNIDPRDIISKPFGIIPTTGDVPTAMANLQELPMRQIPSDYFQFQNDIERQIQGQTFTVDTSNQKGQQALTDTATGARIEFFEANVVLDQVRKNFEQSLSELAYMLLQEAFENMDDNIALKKMGAEEYWEMNKEVLKDAIQRYSIKVEVGSSTYDDIANRREDGMAFWNVMSKAADAGVPVDFIPVLNEVGATFEKRDMSKYIKQNLSAPLPIPKISQNMMPALPPTPAEMTQQVAGGELLTA